MTLRQRLALHYGAVVLIAVSLVTGLTFHEVVTERRLRRLLGPVDESEIQHRKIFDIAVFSIVPIIIAAGWWFTRRSLLPISDLAKTVGGRDIENLHEPLPRTGNGDEVDRLTVAFNVMTKRLDQTFQQIREFNLHASHELKTPLTVMRAEVETALRESESLPPAQREWMHNQLDEIERLTKIVDGLTLLMKADAGQVVLEWGPVWLAELMQECFEDAQILAEPAGVRVSLVECADLVTLGDRGRLRQLLLNLTDNAVKYNCPQGTVTMALRLAGEWAEIEITNTGPGIPPELLPRVFDRFVRGDTATEGSGLGLAIVQWIVRAHCGTIRISSTPGQTTTLTVRLPLADTRRHASP